MKEMSQTWEEKLVKTERLQHERQQALEKMGISVQASGIQVEKNKYYLVNLNDDPSLNELLVYYLKVCNFVSPICALFSVSMLPVINKVYWEYDLKFHHRLRISGENACRRSFSENGSGHSVARPGYLTGTLCYYDRGIGPIHDTAEWRSVLCERHASCGQNSAAARR